MKIAFPTNDKKTIAERTGRCKEFVIYNLADSKIIDISYLKNTHTHHHEHKHHKNNNEKGEHNHDEIAELLKNVNVLVVRRVGKNMKNTLQQFNIKYQLTKKTEMQEVINEFLEGID